MKMKLGALINGFFISRTFFSAHIRIIYLATISILWMFDRLSFDFIVKGCYKSQGSDMNNMHLHTKRSSSCLYSQPQTHAKEAGRKNSFHEDKVKCT